MKPKRLFQLLGLVFAASAVSCTCKNEDVSPSWTEFHRLSAEECATLNYKTGENLRFVRRFYEDAVDTLTVTLSRIQADTIFLKREMLADRRIHNVWGLQQRLQFETDGQPVFELIKTPAYEGLAGNFSLIYENKVYTFKHTDIRGDEFPSFTLEGRTYANVEGLAKDRLQQPAILVNQEEGLLYIKGSTYTLNLLK